MVLHQMVAVESIPLSLEGFQLTPTNGNTKFGPNYVQEIMRYSKAAEMLNYMNESVNPCTNFYAFACGNWAKHNPANSYEHLTTGLFEMMTKALERKIVAILEEGAHEQDTVVDRMVKNFYRSCFNVTRNAAKYREKLLAIIAEFGEMPLLKGDAWEEEKFDWLETVGRISHVYGQDIIIGLDIMADFNENSINRVYIGHPDFPLESSSMYLDDSNEIYRDAYRTQMADQIHKHLGVDRLKATEAANEIVDFEIGLAHGMVNESLGLGMDELSQLTTLDEMQKKYAPTLDIKRLVYTIVQEEISESVYEFVEQYQHNLKELIETTPKRIVANYIFYNLLLDFFISEPSSPQKQTKKCVEKTRKNFSKNLDNIIFRRYTNRETQKDVELIWQELKETFASVWRSNKLHWITESTRERALEKLEAMTLSLNSYENDNINAEMENVTITDSDYVGNIQSFLKATSSSALQMLHKPPEPLEAAELLSYTPANIILENTIKIPVSLLQPYYLWAANYPNALKFGSLGSLIGHEIMHGFDDNGRKFDDIGNNNDWWDDESTDSFIEKTACFDEQYSKYVYGGRFLPKSSSQSENIADNGGVRLAYAAYFKWLSKALLNNESMRLETLPKMNYTSKQLFFISYAQVWCNDVSPRVRSLQLATDDHVPGKYRVIGPLSNFPEFSKEFNCPEGSKMNPSSKCQIY